jgi:hypothetical protein
MHSNNRPGRREEEQKKVVHREEIWSLSLRRSPVFAVVSNNLPRKERQILKLVGNDRRRVRRKHVPRQVAKRSNFVALPRLSKAVQAYDMELKVESLAVGLVRPHRGSC